MIFVWRSVCHPDLICWDLRGQKSGVTSTALWQLSSSSLSFCRIIRASLCPIKPADHCYGWRMHKLYPHLAPASGYQPVSTSWLERSDHAWRESIAMCVWINCVKDYKLIRLMSWHEITTIEHCGRPTKWISVLQGRSISLNLLERSERTRTDGHTL